MARNVYRSKAEVKAKADKIDRARRLRRSDTAVERRLWEALRGRRLAGLKFVRQLPIGPYYPDFVCRTRKLIVDVDRIDIDRASWIAESLLEWNRESTKGEFPPVLLESFARRLFDWDGMTEDHTSAADSIASALFGSDSSFEVGPDGGRIQLGRRGLSQLKKK